MNEVAGLKREIESNWGIDDQMGRDYVMNSPLGVFAGALHKRDPEVLCWLVWFTAIRVLPCWEYHCLDDRPRKTIEAIGRFLSKDLTVQGLKPYILPTEPCVDDCRESDAGSASDAIAFAARYLVELDPIIAACSISAADCAYRHIFTEDRFREWLLDVALPCAAEKRSMNEDEINKYRAEKRDFLQ